MSTAPRAMEYPASAEYRRIRYLDIGGLVLTLLTVVAAVIWAFPLYWAVITTFKPEHEVVRPYIELWPDTFTVEAYFHIIANTKIVRWYINSIIVSGVITVAVVGMSAACGYAISQLRFPGRTLLWWLILASFMVPIQALIVNHFVIMSNVGLVNTLPGIILPQLIAPVVIIVYKQFFDSVPRDFREAAVIDGASEFQLLFKIYLPMNWGVTTALAIITFIGAWNAFLWPFLVTTTEDVMPVAVGITQVQDAFGIYYARLLAGAVMTGLPVAIVYLIFQRRVTQAIMLTAGVKG
jgi:multiple sugar transport system permease protein